MTGRMVTGRRRNPACRPECWTMLLKNRDLEDIPRNVLNQHDIHTRYTVVHALASSKVPVAKLKEKFEYLDEHKLMGKLLAKDRDGDMPLQSAIYSGADDETIKLILHFCPEATKQMLENHNSKDTALEWFLSEGDVGIFMLLLEQCIKCKALEDFVWKGDGQCSTLLHQCIKGRHIQFLKAYMEVCRNEGVKLQLCCVDQKGHTPWYYLVRYKETELDKFDEVLEILQKHDVVLSSLLVNEKSKETMLHLAYRLNKLRFIDHLIARQPQAGVSLQSQASSACQQVSPQASVAQAQPTPPKSPAASHQQRPQATAASQQPKSPPESAASHQQRPQASHQQRPQASHQQRPQASHQQRPQATAALQQPVPQESAASYQQRPRANAVLHQQDSLQATSTLHHQSSQANAAPLQPKLSQSKPQDTTALHRPKSYANAAALHRPKPKPQASATSYQSESLPAGTPYQPRVPRSKSPQPRDVAQLLKDRHPQRTQPQPDRPVSPPLSLPSRLPHPESPQTEHPPASSTPHTSMPQPHCHQQPRPSEAQLPDDASSSDVVNEMVEDASQHDQPLHWITGWDLPPVAADPQPLYTHCPVVTQTPDAHQEIIPFPSPCP